MKRKIKLIRLALTLSRSTWLQPAMLTLVVGVVLFRITDCKPHH